MNTNDPEEMRLSEAEPYRTPAEVSGPAHRGRAPIAWILVIGSLLAFVGAWAFARRSTGQSTIEYIDDFGGTRAGPPMEDIIEPPMDEIEIGAGQEAQPPSHEH